MQISCVVNSELISAFVAADQCLCLGFIDSKIPLLFISDVSSLLPFSVSVQPVLLEDMFSHDVVQKIFGSYLNEGKHIFLLFLNVSLTAHRDYLLILRQVNL